GVDGRADLPHERGVATRAVARAAALARAIAGSLGLVRRGEEADVLALRPARGARRAAVDLRRAHGDNEVAVGRAAALGDCFPPRALVPLPLCDFDNHGFTLLRRSYGRRRQAVYPDLAVRAETLR